MLCNPADSALAMNHEVACSVRIPSPPSSKTPDFFLGHSCTFTTHTSGTLLSTLQDEVTHRTPEAFASRHITIACLPRPYDAQEHFANDASLLLFQPCPPTDYAPWR